MDILKYLVAPEMTVSQLMPLIRKRLKPRENPLYLTFNRRLIDFSITFEEIYDKYKKDDYILYLEVTSEMLWG